jgi:hypothetical protein
MPSPKELAFSYVTGAARKAHLAYFSVVTDELSREKLDHSLFLEWNRGIWRGSNIAPVKWTTVGATVTSTPIEQGLFLGYWGQVHCMGSGDVHEEKILSAGGESPEQRGPMRGLRSIGGKAYAVGTHRQVYRRDGANTWTCIDETTRPESEDPRVVSFESIDGFSPEEIYAAGRQGEIWLYDSRQWHRLNSPTNMILTDVCCAGDGNVYVCGRYGTLLRGRDGRWEVIGQESTQEDLWRAIWYREKLYLSTMRFLYTLEDNRLEQVDFGGDVPITCFHLSAADGVLWSIGAKDVMSYEGTNWVRID